MNIVLVNPADWEGPDLPDGWVIANAPRPLAGAITWTGRFRHGIFYAAAAEALAGSWERDDAWIVEFVTDADIEKRVLVKAAEYGYQTREALEADGITVAEIAYGMQLPYIGETANR